MLAHAYHGTGSYVWGSRGDGESLSYTGEWNAGVKEGKGAYSFADGRTRTGTWAKNAFVK